MDDRFAPDEYLESLYGAVYRSPFEGVTTREEALRAGDEVRARLRGLLRPGALPGRIGQLRPVTVRAREERGGYLQEQLAVPICKGLTMAVYVLRPAKPRGKMPGVVAACGHGYGARQIVRTAKSGRKKLLPFWDGYQRDFAVELAKRGNVVVAPELAGFGEARLKQDRWKPFYASSCDTLSHRLLPYGLTTASLRVEQVLRCVDLLCGMEEVDAGKIGCMGISGGGLAALYAACLDNRIQKIVVSGYINRFRDSILAMWHCPDNYIPGILQIGEIYDFACALAPRRLLMEAGARDRLFPIGASRLAAERIARIYRLCGVPERFTVDFFAGKHSVSGAQSFDFFTTEMGTEG